MCTRRAERGVHTEGGERRAPEGGERRARGGRREAWREACTRAGREARRGRRKRGAEAKRQQGGGTSTASCTSGFSVRHRACSGSVMALYARTSASPTREPKPHTSPTACSKSVPTRSFIPSSVSVSEMFLFCTSPAGAQDTALPTFLHAANRLSTSGSTTVASLSAAGCGGMWRSTALTEKAPKLCLAKCSAGVVGALERSAPAPTVCGSSAAPCPCKRCSAAVPPTAFIVSQKLRSS